jgi:ABC-type multidrug transport system fused ATPase/permease subunit
MKIKYRLPKIDFTVLRRIYAQFGGHLRPHRRKLTLSFLAMLGVSGIAILNPWPLKIVLDFIILPSQAQNNPSFLKPLAGWEPMSVLTLAVGAVLALAVLGGLLGYTQDIMAKSVGHALAASIRLQVFSHAQRLPQSYHDYRETGDLLTRITGDITLLEELLVETMIRLSGQALQVLGILVLMFLIDWHLGLIIVAVLPLFLLSSFRFTREIKRATRRQREKYGRMVTSVQETFAGISQVKSFGQEDAREKLVGKSVDRDFRASLKTTKLTANYARLVEVIGAMGTCLVLWFGVRRAIAGHISAGDLVIFISYLRGVYRPLLGMARLSARVSKAAARGEKVLEVLEIEPEVKDAPDARSAGKVEGEIQFENIDFSYHNGKRVLCEFSCRVPSGKTTVLLGPTGAGKSTIAKLLLRLYEPQAGAIWVDGRNIREYRVKSLRKRITSLTQEPFLFRLNIRENIAFGKPKASFEEIVEAARLVRADDFIRRLPAGYETLVGEGGLTLSGGQRQRVSFARAALRNSPVMIFDEPATGLDVRSEKEAKEALGALKAGRTMLIITHRLNFLDLADWVILIRDGGLIDQGRPAELMARSESFKTYVAGEYVPMERADDPPEDSQHKIQGP